MRPLLAILATAACLIAAAALPAPADAARTLVRYSSGGGLAGGAVDLRVRTSGKARLLDGGSARSGEASDTRRFTLSRKQLRRLRKDLRAARLQDCRSSYASDVPVADGITQRVAAGGTAVSVATGGDPPQRLERLLGRLQTIVDRHR